MRAIRKISTLSTALLMAMPLLGAGVATKKTALITIPVKFEVKATPTKVWVALTSLDGFGTLTGFKLRRPVRR